MYIYIYICTETICNSSSVQVVLKKLKLLRGDFIGIETKHTWISHNNWVQDKCRIVQSAFKQSQAHGGHRHKSPLRSS